MARIDDVLYVDDAIKRCIEPESNSVFNRGLGGLPIQKRMSPSPFSIHHSPFASPFATPTFCSSTPIGGSPGRLSPSPTVKRSNMKEEAGVVRLRPEREREGDKEKIWSYAGNLSGRRISGVTPERD